MNREPSLGDVLRSLVFYLLFYGGSVAIVIACVVTLFAASPQTFRRTVDSWSLFHRWCMRNVLGITIAVEGEMPAGPAFVAMKHESFFEAIDLPQVLDFPGVFTKAELMRIPLWGLAGDRYGLITVEREQGAKTLRHMMQAAKRISGQGRPLAIFPEGTRVPVGTKPELKSGFAGIYKLLGLPVVPIAVNSGVLYHRLWKRSGVITYRIAPPIPPGLPRDEAEALVHAAINVLNP
ncbi:MAG: lysophospholipid acyltransferase family protein [Novosphingobium sp.]